MDAKLFSRRAFLRLSAATAAGTLLAACAAAPTAPPAGVSEAPAAAPTAAAESAAAEPVASGGTLRTDWGATTSKLNPWTTGGGIQLTDMIWNRLVELDWNYDEIVPGLAESWEVSDDGLEWTFYLRQGVKWHDGEPFTADDVVFTYTALMSPLLGGWQPAYLTPVKGFTASKAGESGVELGVSAVDDFTVKITTERPAANMLGNLAALWILPEHHLGGADLETITDHEYFTTSAVGTGAFKLTEAVFDQFLVVERNPDFFRGAPRIDRIISNQIADRATKVLSMEKGDLDVIDLRTPDEISRMKASQNVTVFSDNSPLTQFIQVNVNQPYLADKRVRQALIYALDRETINQTLYQGIAEIVNWGVFKSWIPTDGLNSYPYDPDKAKALLAEAGFDMDQELRLWFYYTDEFHRRLGAVLKQAYEDLGLKIALNIRSSTDSQAEYQAGEWDLQYAGSGAIDPDDLRTHFYSKTQYGTATYNDPELDALFDAEVVEIDQEARGKICYDLLARLNDQQYWIWMWKPGRSWAVSNRVGEIVGKVGGVGFHPPLYHGEETWYIKA